MGKRVKVVTSCGEIHHYEYNQEVETVEIVEVEADKNLTITKQKDIANKGHWHFEDERGGYMGNIYIEGKKVEVVYCDYEGVSVETRT